MTDRKGPMSNSDGNELYHSEGGGQAVANFVMDVSEAYLR